MNTLDASHTKRIKDLEGGGGIELAPKAIRRLASSCTSFDIPLVGSTFSFLQSSSTPPYSLLSCNNKNQGCTHQQYGSIPVKNIKTLKLLR